MCKVFRFPKNHLKSEKASIIVEAAVVIPLFLLFILTFIFLSDTYFAQAKMKVALNQTAQDLANFGYIYHSETATKGEAFLNGFMNLFSTVTHFPDYNYSSTSITTEDELDRLEDFYDAVHDNPIAVAATTILLKHKYEPFSDSDKWESKIDNTVTKALIKRHITSDAGNNDKVTNILNSMSIRSEYGQKNGLDGVNFEGTKIFKDQDPAMTASHNWVFNPTKWTVKTWGIPHECTWNFIVGDSGITNQGESFGDINQNEAKRMLNTNAASDFRIRKGDSDNHTCGNGDDGRAANWRSRLSVSCRMLGKLGYHMIYRAKYKPSARITEDSSINESCESLGTPIDEVTVRKFPRNLITLHAKFYVQPLGWFGKFRVPIELVSTAETWVPPAKRAASVDASTFNPGTGADINSVAPKPFETDYRYTGQTTGKEFAEEWKGGDMVWRLNM